MGLEARPNTLTELDSSSNGDFGFQMTRKGLKLQRLRLRDSPMNMSEAVGLRMGSKRLRIQG